MTVYRLQRELGDGELDGWMQMWELEPFGCEWYRTALLCSTFANYNAWGLKRPTSPDDFMPVRHPKKMPDPAKLHNAFLATMAALGHKIAPSTN